jgi:predicted ATP-dependent endonuclease of OLD family
MLIRLETLEIANLRCVKQQSICFDRYTAFVGPNGHGKSTVFAGLNILFGQLGVGSGLSSELKKEDFHNLRTDAPIEITASFTDLTDAEMGELREQLVNDHLVLRVTASWDELKGVVAVQNALIKKRIESFDIVRSKENHPVSETRPIYESLIQEFKELPRWESKSKSFLALEEYERQYPDRCTIGPVFIPSCADFLNPFVTWVYVPAVTDSRHEEFESRETALGKLISQRIRTTHNFDSQLRAIERRAAEEYLSVIDAAKPHLEELRVGLQERLRDLTHKTVSLDLVWSAESPINVQEPRARMLASEYCSVNHTIEHLGHGTQRCLIVALLQECATATADGGPALFVGIEEPELYQHPPQARHLLETLTELTAHGRDQVAVTTHSPYFVSGESFESLRMVRLTDDPPETTFKQATFEQVSEDLERVTGKQRLRATGIRAKIQQELLPNLSELFFATRSVLVEGQEDAAYLTAYLHVSNKWRAFRDRGSNIVIANGKGHMLQPLAIANRLGIPVYTVFDADGSEQDPSKRELHRRDNVQLLGIIGSDNEEPFPAQPLVLSSVTIWPDNIGATFKSECDPESFSRWKAAAESACGQAGSLGKNVVFISTLVELAYLDGHRSSALEALTDKLIEWKQTG